MSDHFNLDAERFMWARRGVSDDAVRSYLVGVRIEPRPEGGALFVATDGHLMLIAADPTAVCPRAVTVNLRLTEARMDHLPPERGLVYHEPRQFCGRLSFDLPAGGGAQLARFRWPRDDLTYLLAVAEETPGDYPNWKRLLNARDQRVDGVTVLDPTLIERVAHQRRGVAIVPRGGAASRRGGQPSIILPNGAPWAFGLLMPRGSALVADIAPPDALVRDLIDAADLAALGGAGS